MFICSYVQMFICSFVHMFICLSPIILWIICKIEDYFISLQAKFSAFMEQTMFVFGIVSLHAV